MFIYIHNLKSIKNNYNNYYKVIIYIGNNSISVTGYLDTGNKLVSPYSNKPVIILHNKSPVFDNMDYVLIPYNTIDNFGFIKCYKPDKVYIEGVGDRYSLLVGVTQNIINIDGVECILNTKILEEK